VIPRIALRDGFEISRIIKGGWHLAGGHGSIDPAQAMRDMAAFVDAGITTFDCADIYTGVEQLIGDFRREYPAYARRVQVFTKFVPDLDALPHLDRRSIERIIHRSLERLGVEQLDAVQFHWWDFAIAGYVETALELRRLQEQGKIARVSVTNWDTDHLSELTNAGVRIATHQLQYSLLDNRPEQRMLKFCEAHQIGLLCYGTVAGGFLSERWLGQPEPSEPFANRSLVKYKLILEDFGGWPLFQSLLRALQEIARKHETDIATVATRYILHRPGVSAAIVGATSASHLASHQRIGQLILDAGDQARLAQILAKREGPTGDVYTLERDRTGRHGRIMRYNLSQPEKAVTQN
jgi:aryl-alcohol dehydrogenase-like predicted oxidoreductase